ncbi:GtrA family protein [bacterium]|nr:GtrA family protein [bacterium]
MILTNAKERSRFIRFAIVGAAGAVIDFGVFNFLTNLVGYFKEHVVWASVISFILAVISNFTWNRLWTYPDSRSKPLARQLTQFVAVSVIGLLIRTPLFSFLEKALTLFFTGRWSFKPLTPVIVAHNLALAIVILLVMIWNFIANRYWTYNDVKA